jgi:hypothetical protein
MGYWDGRAIEFWCQVVCWSVSDFLLPFRWVCLLIIRSRLMLLSIGLSCLLLLLCSARPEEVLWKIAQHQVTSNDGCPQDIIDEVLAFNMSGPTSCTAYPEGSPTHPSWPAMHSAASSSAMWLGLVMNLTDSQWCEAKKMDWGVGTFLFHRVNVNIMMLLAVGRPTFLSVGLTSILSSTWFYTQHMPEQWQASIIQPTILLD